MKFYAVAILAMTVSALQLEAIETSEYAKEPEMILAEAENGNAEDYLKACKQKLDRAYAISLKGTKAAYEAAIRDSFNIGFTDKNACFYWLHSTNN